MKKLKSKNFWQETIIGTLFLFSIEIITRVVSSFAIFEWATLRIFISSMVLVLVFELMLSFFKKRVTRERFLTLLYLVASGYAWMQVGLHNFLGVYISFGASSQLGAVVSYVKEFLMSTHIEYYFIFIPLLIYLLYLRGSKKRDNQNENINWETRLKGVLVFIVTSFIYLGTLLGGMFQNPLQPVSNFHLFLSPTNSAIAINQFGTSVFSIIDFKQFILPKHLIIESGSEDPPLENTREFDDSTWQKLIDDESNEVYNSLNKYFISRPISKTNEFTGYFEGKNLIVVMLESINNTILNSEYFPNFKRILDHAWSWENNYSPRNSCATGDNEFSGMTSIYALNSSCTANVYQDNKYFNAIFNRFLSSGYETSSYHDYDSTYYTRDVFHLNMGSLNYYDMVRLNLDYNPNLYLDWPSDVELMEKASAIFTQKVPFMAWITTVSAHQPYDIPSRLGDQYLSLFAKTDYTIALKRYLSKVKVTDDALGALLDELEAKDILKDTVIVLYGDHYPYGLVDSDVSSVVDYDITEFYERERVPFVIYNSELEPKVFSTKTSYINLLPTVANLFNLEYDPRFYFGEDLFSETFSNRVVFADSSWEDDIARFKSGTSEVTYFNEERYSTKELQAINNEIYQKKEMSKLAVVNNYFNYLDQKLKDYEQANKKEEEIVNEKSNDCGVSTQE